jgi:hypothetical protein
MIYSVSRSNGSMVGALLSLKPFLARHISLFFILNTIDPSVQTSFFAHFE